MVRLLASSCLISSLMSSSGDNSPEPAVDTDGGVSVAADVLGAVDIAEEQKFPKLQRRCSGRTERA